MAADAVLALLHAATLPLLVPAHALVTRAAATASFGIALAPAAAAEQAWAALPPPPRSGAYAPDSDAAVVAATLHQCLTQQRGWLLAQLLDASAAVHGLADAAAGCGLAPGDILTHIEDAPLAGLAFDDVAAAVIAAPRTARVRVLRVTRVTALDALGALMPSPMLA